MTNGANVHPYQIGEEYFVRTVTNYYVGRLEAVYPGEIVLSACSWVADTGRFHVAMKTGSLEEVEPYPRNISVIVSRGAIVDACVWLHPLPEEAI